MSLLFSSQSSQSFRKNSFLNCLFSSLPIASSKCCHLAIPFRNTPSLFFPIFPSKQIIRPFESLSLIDFCYILHPFFSILSSSPVLGSPISVLLLSPWNSSASFTSFLYFSSHCWWSPGQGLTWHFLLCPSFILSWVSSGPPQASTAAEKLKTLFWNSTVNQLLICWLNISQESTM